MKLRHIGIAILAAGFLSAQAFAQTLWQNVNSGMSIDEVRTAQPSVVNVATPDKLATGATDNLQIPAYTLDGISFDVRFFFLDGKLAQVGLTATGRPSYANYDDLVQALRSQHGPETSGGKTAIGHQTKWQGVNGLNITIFYLSELNGMLRIAYAPAPA